VPVAWLRLGHTGAVTPPAARQPHRQLWLLRHAKTEQDPPPGGADRDRRLAPRGQRDAEALGGRLARLAAGGGGAGWRGLEPPKLVLSSSAARTRQTADATLSGLDPGPPVEYLDALYAASPQEILRHLVRVEDGVASVMVVGHNPTVETLAPALLSREDRSGRKKLERRSFPTCALAIYEVPPWGDLDVGRARLLRFLTPPY
jgi:phosphohistidine phosphatase